MADKIHWIKKGGGSFYLGPNKIIKPGEKFWAYEDEIPQGFRDVIVPIDGTILPKPGKAEPQTTGKKATFEVKPIESGITIEPKGKSKTWFNVVKDGKVLNVKAKSKADAEALKAELEADLLKPDAKEWNVVDVNGKVLNGTPLTKEIAEKFKTDLEK